MKAIVEEFSLTYLEESVYFTVIIVDCSMASFNYIQEQDHVYTLGEQLNMKISPWTTQNPSDCGTITYSYSVNP